MSRRQTIAARMPEDPGVPPASIISVELTGEEAANFLVAVATAFEHLDNVRTYAEGEEAEEAEHAIGALTAIENKINAARG